MTSGLCRHLRDSPVASDKAAQNTPLLRLLMLTIHLSHSPLMIKQPNPHISILFLCACRTVPQCAIYQSRLTWQPLSMHPPTSAQRRNCSRERTAYAVHLLSTRRLAHWTRQRRPKAIHLRSCGHWLRAPLPLSCWHSCQRRACWSCVFCIGACWLHCLTWQRHAAPHPRQRRQDL